MGSEIDATQIIQDSLLTHGTTIALAHATDLFNKQVNTAIVTHYNLNPRRKKQTEKYLGEKINCQAEKKTSSDHAPIQVARDLARVSVEQASKPMHNNVKTLFVGSTEREVKRYGSNPSNYFHFHGEDKDNARNIALLSGIFAKTVNKLDIPALTSMQDGNTLEFEMHIDKIIKVLSKLSLKNGHGRILTSSIKEKSPGQFGILHFQDCLYNMEEEEFMEYFEKTGAFEGHAVIFHLNRFLDETTPESNIYKYEETNIFSDYKLLIREYLGPIVLFLSNLIPLDYAEELITDIVASLLNFSHTHIWNWIRNVTVTYNPLATLISNLVGCFKYKVFLGPIIEKFKLYLERIFTVATVVWKDGFQNGYTHNKYSWSKWVNTGRWYGKGFVVDREVVARYGEMYHLKFNVNNGTQTLVHCISIAEQFQGMAIIDLDSSWDEKNVRFGTIKYKQVYRSEFFEALQWALGEDLDSLDLDIVVTAVNRLKAGLSINTSELVPSWNLKSNDITNFAAVVLLETYKIKNAYNTLIENKEYVLRHESNFKRYSKMLGKGILFVSTIGAAGLLLDLYYWMTKTKRIIPFTKDIYEAPIVRELPLKLKTLNTLPNSSSFIGTPKVPFVFPGKNLKDKINCEFCAYAKKGVFGKQELICKVPRPQLQKLEIKPADMGPFYIKVLSAITDHEGFNATKVVEQIKKLKDFLKARLTTGISTNVIIHNIEGGPGSGKSVLAREIAHIREGQGKNVAVISPFSELLDDYTDVKLLDGTTKTFTFKTTYKAFELLNQQVLIVEEKGAFDILLLTALAVMNNTEEIFIIGDVKQTILQNSEGFSIARSDAPIDLNAATHHILRKNFRNNPFNVKVLNEIYNYEMTSARTDYEPIKFVTKAEYTEITERRNEINGTLPSNEKIPPIEEMSFSKDAIDLFGGSPHEKHTVRSKQGKGYLDVAVALTEADTNLLEVQGMIVVAISRARNITYVVTPENVSDNLVTALKIKLKLSSEEEIKSYIDAPWPEATNVSFEEPLAQETLDFQALLLDNFPTNSLKASGDLERNLYLQGKVIAEAERRTLENFEIYDKLGHCFFEAFLSNKASEERTKYEHLYKKYLLNLNINLEELAKTFPTFEKPPAMTVKQFLGFIDSIQEKVAIKYKQYSEFKFNRIFLSMEARSDLGGKDITEIPKDIIVLLLSKSHCKTRSELTAEELKFLRWVPSKPEFSIIKDNKSTKCKIFTECHGKLAIEHIDIRKEKSRYLLNKDDTEAAGPFKIKAIKSLETAMSIKEKLSLARFPIALPSSFKEINLEEMQREIKDRPLKYGKDGYLFTNLIDKSTNYKTKTGYNQLNVIGNVKGPTKEFKVGSRLIKDGFLFERTKNLNQVRKPKNITSRAFTLGLGNEFNGTPTDTLIAGQRYLTKKKQKHFSFEGQAYARRLAEEFVRENTNYLRKDQLTRNEIYQRTLKDMKDRKYFLRGEKELRKTITRKLNITFHNRKIFKPLKSGKLNLMKGGQGIAQTPSWFNFEHCAQMRLINREFHDSMKTNVFYDNLLPLNIFRRDLTNKINKLPKGVLTGITDAEEFDANQGWFTIEIERHTKRLMGVSELYLESYFACRRPANFRAFGLFSGRTNGEKGSGYLDTLLGNTNTSMVLSDRVLRGVGPCVKAGKGDDFLKVQAGLKQDKDFCNTLLRFSNLKFHIQIGKGGEFCGDTVSREGCFPSITRAAFKAFAARSNSYKDFTEKQISYRDKIADIKLCGVNRVIAANMKAENRTRNQVETALSCLNSIGHISKQQWEKKTNHFGKTKCLLPGADRYFVPLIEREILRQKF